MARQEKQDQYERLLGDLDAGRLSQAQVLRRVLVVLGGSDPYEDEIPEDQRQSESEEQRASTA